LGSIIIVEVEELGVFGRDEEKVIVVVVEVSHWSSFSRVVG